MEPASTRPPAHESARVPGVPGSASDVALLGGFRLWVHDAEVDLPAGAQRLLALLALRGRTSRTRTAGTLWPQTTENRALANLRTAIWRVNHCAPHVLSAVGGSVDLDPEIDVDVRRLAHATDVLASAVAGDEEVLAAWHELPSTPAELLPDWEDDWLLADRERVWQSQLHLLEQFAGCFVSQARYGLALDAALAALRADVLRESAHRAVIRVHLAEGNTVEARRALEFCRTVLTRDAGVEPSVATTQLVLPRRDLLRTGVRVVVR